MLTYKTKTRSITLSQDLTDFLLSLGCLWLHYKPTNQDNISRHLKRFELASLSLELQMIDPLCFEIIAQGKWQGKKI
jgi:hypothetical protein|tara:strand:+ start:2491 stop:2721 length:231 start_codon:yes stop_codon:yes gene_type:complete